MSSQQNGNQWQFHLNNMPQQMEALWLDVQQPQPQHTPAAGLVDEDVDMMDIDDNIPTPPDIPYTRPSQYGFNFDDGYVNSGQGSSNQPAATQTFQIAPAQGHNTQVFSQPTIPDSTAFPSYRVRYTPSPTQGELPKLTSSLGSTSHIPAPSFYGASFGSYAHPSLAQYTATPAATPFEGPVPNASTITEGKIIAPKPKFHSSHPLHDWKSFLNQMTGPSTPEPDLDYAKAPLAECPEDEE